MKRIHVRELAALIAGLTIVASPAIAAAPAPTPGTCWDLSASDWDRSTMPAGAATVACTTSHTAQTLAVVHLSTKLAHGPSRKLWGYGYRECSAMGLKFLGAPAKSALPTTAQLATYLPSRSQWRAGHRWIHCVGFNTTPRGRVTARVGSVEGSGATPSICVNTTTGRYVPCSAKTAPLTHAVWIAKNLGETYPGDKVALARTGAKCARLARAKDLKLGIWYVEGRGYWNYGNRFGFCSLR